ncbi:MAG: WxL domain-containing protein [Solirubrobacteraceae bacterium]|nr:WxL domain-containing protein [Solirubrobacteraceae bacterium]
MSLLPALRHTAVLLLTAGVAVLMTAAPAHAQTATATQQISGGSLAFIGGTPGDVTFPPVSLTGSDQTNPASQTFTVSDARGSEAGWSISATSTTFTSGSDTLPTDATTITSFSGLACDGGSSCTPASNAITPPYALPAAAVAPVATKMFNAQAGSGMGNQDFNANWQLSIPAATPAGTYTSTWTFTLGTTP